MRNVEKERVEIHLTKEVGTDEANVVLEASSSGAAVYALAHLVEHIAEGCGASVEHVLSVLAVVLLTPGMQEEEKEER